MIWFIKLKIFEYSHYLMYIFVCPNLLVTLFSLFFISETTTTTTTSTTESTTSTSSTSTTPFSTLNDSNSTQNRSKVTVNSPALLPSFSSDSCTDCQCPCAETTELPNSAENSATESSLFPTLGLYHHYLLSDLFTTFLECTHIVVE